jgi:hypothetical protein
MRTPSGASVLSSYLEINTKITDYTYSTIICLLDKMFPPSADYALELSRPPNLRSDDPLYHRLRTALICVVNIWLFFQQNLHNVEIACVLPRDNSLPSLACLYGCHPSFFTIFRPGPHHASDRNDEGLDGGIWKLSQKVRRAILTNNTCHTFCLVFADVVQKLLKGMSFEHI